MGFSGTLKQFAIRIAALISSGDKDKKFTYGFDLNSILQEENIFRRWGI